MKTLAEGAPIAPTNPSGLLLTRLGDRVRFGFYFVTLAWLTLALLLKPFFAYVDFGTFYSTAIFRIVTGWPLEIYSFVVRPSANGLPIPLSQPPLWFFLEAPWFALAMRLGFDDLNRQVGFSWGQAWMIVPNLPFDVLLCVTALRLCDLKHRLSEPLRLGLFACLLCSPILWLSSVRYGHNESVMVALVLAAVWASEKNRDFLTGVLWGLALGIKTTAIVPALIYYGWKLNKRPAAACRSGAIAGIVFFCRFFRTSWSARNRSSTPCSDSSRSGPCPGSSCGSSSPSAPSSPRTRTG